MPVLLDSSCWIEYFLGSARGRGYLPPIQEPESLIVPTICLYEVLRRLSRQVGVSAASALVVEMRQGLIVELSEDLALAAVELGLRHRLPLADSIIYASALAHNAEVWTQDEDFDGLEHVRFFT